MTTLEQTNNHAASLITSGRCIEAYDELLRAMGDLARQITLDENFAPPSQVNPLLTVAPLLPIFPYTDDTCAFSSPLLFTGNGMEDDFSAESLSCAFATALFNMALAIQSSTARDVVPLTERREALWQCQTLYQHAYVIVESLDLPLLRLALSNNLLDLAFEQADLVGVSYWIEKFSQSMEKDSLEVPSYVLIHFLKVQLYFMPSLKSARAA